MAITLAAEPGDGRAAVLRALLAARRLGTPRGKLMAAQRIARQLSWLKVALPLPVYSYAGSRPPRGSALTTAKLCGFQYMLLRDGKAVSTVDLILGSDGRARVTGFSTGPALDELHGAVGKLERTRNPKLSGELRLLWLPRLGQRLLWIHGRSDHFVPVLSATSSPRNGGKP